MALTTLTNIGKGITSLFKAKGATHARELSERFSDTINVLDYGISDSIGVDNTVLITALQSKAKQEGKILYFPAGKYKSTQGVSNQIVYKGEGIIYSDDARTVINKAFIKLGQGEPDAIVAPCSAILRQNTPNSNWYCIDDDGHRINGFHTTASTQPTTPQALDLKFQYTVDEICSASAIADEYYQAQGVTAGASISSDTVSLYANKDAYITVDNITREVTTHPFFSNTITCTYNESSGEFTVTHPDCEDESSRPMICMHHAGSRPVPMLPVIQGMSRTSFNYSLYMPASGYVYYDTVSTSWKVKTDMVTAPTITASSDGLILDFGQQSDPEFFCQVTSREGKAIVGVEGQTSSSVKVSFIRLSDMIRVNPSTNTGMCNFYFHTDFLVKMKARSGAVNILRPKMRIHWANMASPDGNFWLQGFMQPHNKV